MTTDRMAATPEQLALLMIRSIGMIGGVEMLESARKQSPRLRNGSEGMEPDGSGWNTGRWGDSGLKLPIIYTCINVYCRILYSMNIFQFLKNWFSICWMMFRSLGWSWSSNSPPKVGAKNQSAGLQLILDFVGPISRSLFLITCPFGEPKNSKTVAFKQTFSVPLPMPIIILMISAGVVALVALVVSQRRRFANTSNRSAWWQGFDGNIKGSSMILGKILIQHSHASYQICSQRSKRKLHHPVKVRAMKMSRLAM